jgi:pimeloyl-ACP methyl ester carboxylesterase
VSTPTTLELPTGVRRTTATSARGAFAVLEALPATGVAEFGTALLVPGYTGSKEDFINVLGQLAADGRRVLAVDMRGQYQTQGPDEPAAYQTAQLGADIAALAAATDTMHLLGHSYGGLVARAAVLDAQYVPLSLTLLGSGPAAVPGRRADDLRFVLDYVKDTPLSELGTKIEEIWHAYQAPQAEAAGTPGDIIDFLRKRMLGTNPTGLVTMARELLTAADRTKELADCDIPTFVLYGEDDDAWPAEVQERMAAELGATRSCIPVAAHSPAVEAPATTAQALTRFWNTAEGVSATPFASQRT